MSRSLERGKSANRGRSPMRLEEVIQMTDDTLLELCTPACQQELRELWTSMSERKQGEKELARRGLLLKYQLPVVERYGFEASPNGVAKSTMESYRFFTKSPVDQELGFKGHLLGWMIDPDMQQATEEDYIFAYAGLTSELMQVRNQLEADDDVTSLVLQLRSSVEHALGRKSLSAPLRSIRDATPAARLVSVCLPWAAKLQGRVPVVCAVVEGVLSSLEIANLRDWAEQRGNWEPHQGHLRLKITDAVLAMKLWTRMQHLLPDVFNEMRIAGLNEHIRFLKYQPGHYFLPHTDGQNTSNRYGVARHSEMSAILYLSEPEGDGSGGGTRFISPECSINASTGRCDHVCAKCVDAPVKKGSLLLFAQNLVHAGTEPKAQEKFAMRTDVMYYS